jgi:hypothetical protein
MQSKSLFDRVWAHTLSFATAAITLIVELCTLFVYFIETEGQNIDAAAQVVAVLVVAVSGFGMTAICFAVWRWEDHFVIRNTEDEAQTLFRIASEASRGEDFEFHLTSLVSSPCNLVFQRQMLERLAVVCLACERLFKIDRYQLVYLAIDQLEMILNGAWQRGPRKVPEAEWGRVRDLVLGHLVSFKTQAREAISQQ